LSAATKLHREKCDVEDMITYGNIGGWGGCQIKGAGRFLNNTTQKGEESDGSKIDIDDNGGMDISRW